MYVFWEFISILLLKTSMCMQASLLATLIERGMNPAFSFLVPNSYLADLRVLFHKILCPVVTHSNT